MKEKNEIIVYQPEDGEFHIEVRLENEWLTQAQMAELFGTMPQKHHLAYKKTSIRKGSCTRIELVSFSYKNPFSPVDKLSSQGTSSARS